MPSFVLLLVYLTRLTKNDIEWISFRLFGMKCFYKFRLFHGENNHDKDEICFSFILISMLDKINTLKMLYNPDDYPWKVNVCRDDSDGFLDCFIVISCKKNWNTEQWNLCIFFKQTHKSYDCHCFLFFHVIISPSLSISLDRNYPSSNFHLKIV